MENRFDAIPAAERIIVALDCPVSRARELADMLEGHAVWLKVGMTLFYQTGPAIVEEFRNRGFKVFVDLKFHDIPHQVAGAAQSVAAIGADMITMHAAGGVEMMRAGVEGIRKGVEKRGASEMPVSLAITVLTSMDEDALAASGVNRPIAEQVEALALLAQQAGVTGVVASPLEAPLLREVLGPDAYIVTPGVRPAGSDKGDQSRVTTPAQAFSNGSSHVVIGRPITQADDPAAAFDAIVASII